MFKLILLVIIGAIFHILLNLRSAIADKPKTERFNFKTDFNWRRSLIYTAVSIWLPLLAVVFSEYAELVLGLTINELNAFLLGAFNDSLWKNLRTKGSKRVEIK